MFEIQGKKTKIIAITGARHSGKDSVAKYLMQKSDDIKNIKFATPVKDALKFMFDITDCELEDETLKELIIPRLGFSPRQAMRQLGTEFGRALSPDIWINEVAKKVAEYEQAEKLCVITDLRYPNEAKYVRSVGGIIIHIRPLDVYSGKREHSSDIPLKIYTDDFFLCNRKDGLENFHNNIDNLIKVIL
jgi:hypothetical protein